MKRDIYIAFLAAVSVALSGCGSTDAPVTTTEMPETVSTTSAVPETAENTEISISNAATINKYDLSDIELGEERVWINEAQEYADIISKLGLDKKKHNIIKGVYLAATDDDILYFYAYDEYEIDGITKLGAYSTFEIASATKTFTATAVLQLIERGELSLDDTLGKFFPDYEKGRDITIYQLLHMQAGIYDHINEPEYFYGRGDKETVKKVFFDKFSDEDFLQALYSADLKYEPGTKQSYCNTAYHLLAMIIEQTTGMSYAEYIQKNIFDVCGMEHSSSMKIGDLTTVTSAEGNISEITDNGYSVSPNTDRGDGDIHTCPADLLAFDRALKNGRLINEKSLAEMFNMDMGYGCGMMQISPKIYGHDGNNPGYKTVNQFIETDSGNIYIIKLTHY